MNSALRGRLKQAKKKTKKGKILKKTTRKTKAQAKK
jgi:hypothetical protein